MQGQQKNHCKTLMAMSSDWRKRAEDSFPDSETETTAWKMNQKKGSKEDWILKHWKPFLK